ncbi:MAG TPA: hypothetical protein VFE57_12345, partial [Cyclobacteriaceae bacterium]|nr:hypothetical protein [Cyclobacteriaceae bacterium]
MDFKNQLRVLMGNKNLTINQQLSSVKKTIDSGNYREAIKSYPSLASALTKDAFFATLSDIRLRSPFHFSGDFKKEFRWIIMIIEKYFEQINSFIDLKTSFETKVIEGNYTTAKQILTNIEAQFGITLWSVESNLLLDELIVGSEGNWSKLSFYLTHVNHLVYEFVASSGSKRVESKLTYESFFSQFQNDLDHVVMPAFLKDFFVFRNLSTSKYDYEYPTLEGVIYTANSLSVIDQYLILVDVIIYNIARTKDLDKILLPFITKAKDTIRYDFRLTNIFNTISQNTYQATEDSEIMLECLNSYYSGNFTKSLELSKTLIANFPLEYEPYEVYSKSLLNLDIEFQPLNISPIFDELLQNTYFVLSFKKQ